MAENIKEDIKRIQNSLPEFTGKKTEYENLHLTLKFLREIDEELVEKVKEKLNKIKFEKFEATVDRIGFFSKKFIRIIWLHLNNCERLQKEVDLALKELFEPEERFMSHLTIARIKKIKDKKSFLDEFSKIKIRKSGFMVDKFYLMESKLTKEGPVYSIVKEFSLT